MYTQGKLKLNRFQINYKNIFILVVLIQSLFILYQDNLKHGYFIDEIYSYGLANSSEGPFLNYNNTIQDKWITNKYFRQYLLVCENTKFDYVQVYKNQVCDVHPPFFYMVLHTICSFFPGSFSKWFGLSLNIGLFIATQLFLYLLSMEIFSKNFKRSIAILILYGGTMAAVNPATYIRMYMMLTLLATASYYFHVRLLSNFDFKKLFCIGVITFLGCMTQYYFLIMSFFLAITFCFTYLKRKQWKILSAYAMTMTTSVLLMLVSFPAVFEHLFGGRNVGEKTLQNIELIRGLPHKLFSFFLGISKQYSLCPGRKYVCVIFIFLLLIAIALVIINKKRNLWKIFYNTKGSLQILNSFVFSYIIISLVSYDVYMRYMYFLLPIVTLLACMLFFFIIGAFFVKLKHQDIYFLIIVCLISFENYVMRKTDYLFNEQYDNAKIIEQFKNYPGLFFIKSDSPAALTQECGALMKIDEVYCTEEQNTSRINSILDDKSSDSIIIWVDVDKYWSSGYDSKRIISEVKKYGEYSQDTLLYSYGLVDCYLVKR